MKKDIIAFSIVAFAIIAFAIVAISISNDKGLVAGDYDSNEGKDYDNDKKDDYDEDDYDEEEDYDKDDDYDKKDADYDYDTEEDYDYDTQADSGTSSKTQTGVQTQASFVAAPPVLTYDEYGDQEGDVDSYGKEDGYDYESYIEDKEGKKLTREVVTNADGTVATTTRKTEDDGDIKVRYVLRDPAGNKIEERTGEYDPEEGEGKMRVSTYDQYGEKLTDIRIETKDGKELTVRVQDEEGQQSRVKYDPEKEQLVVRTRGDYNEDQGEIEETYNKITIEAQGDYFIVTRQGVTAGVGYPLTVDNETGEIFIETSAGAIELKAMPDSVVESVKKNGQMDTVEQVEIVEEDTLQYVVTGAKDEKILGLFTVQIPLAVAFNAETGEFEETEQGFWSKTLDLFSI